MRRSSGNSFAPAPRNVSSADYLIVAVHIIGSLPIVRFLAMVVLLIVVRMSTAAAAPALPPPLRLQGNDIDAALVCPSEKTTAPGTGLDRNIWHEFPGRYLSIDCVSLHCSRAPGYSDQQGITLLQPSGTPTIFAISCRTCQPSNIRNRRNRACSDIRQARCQLYLLMDAAIVNFGKLKSSTQPEL